MRGRRPAYKSQQTPSRQPCTVRRGTLTEEAPSPSTPCSWPSPLAPPAPPRSARRGSWAREGQDAAAARRGWSSFVSGPARRHSSRACPTAAYNPRCNSSRCSHPRSGTARRRRPRTRSTATRRPFRCRCLPISSNRGCVGPESEAPAVRVAKPRSLPRPAPLRRHPRHRPIASPLPAAAMAGARWTSTTKARWLQRVSRPPPRLQSARPRCVAGLPQPVARRCLAPAAATTPRRPPAARHHAATPEGSRRHGCCPQSPFCATAFRHLCIEPPCAHT
mmetsp:Transcript_47865/g.154318  ORF Transcript_47865/g.154318 Transcript_47865/m.154318 type:complete len:277 (+) Transcript_47865:159-989(+)